MLTEAFNAGKLIAVIHFGIAHRVQPERPNYQNEVLSRIEIDRDFDFLKVVLRIWSV